MSSQISMTLTETIPPGFTRVAPHERTFFFGDRFGPQARVFEGALIELSQAHLGWPDLERWTYAVTHTDTPFCFPGDDPKDLISLRIGGRIETLPAVVAGLLLSCWASRKICEKAPCQNLSGHRTQLSSDMEEIAANYHSR